MSRNRRLRNFWVAIIALNLLPITAAWAGGEVPKHVKKYVAYRISEIKSSVASDELLGNLIQFDEYIQKKCKETSTQKSCKSNEFSEFKKVINAFKKQAQTLLNAKSPSKGLNSKDKEFLESIIISFDDAKTPLLASNLRDTVQAVLKKSKTSSTTQATPSKKATKKADKMERPARSFLDALNGGNLSDSDLKKLISRASFSEDQVNQLEEPRRPRRSAQPSSDKPAPGERSDERGSEPRRERESAQPKVERRDASASPATHASPAPSSAIPASTSNEPKIIAHEDYLDSNAVEKYFWGFRAELKSNSGSPRASLYGRIPTQCANKFEFIQVTDPQGSGCENTVGFKIIDEEGRGRKCISDVWSSGRVCNQKTRCTDLSTIADTSFSISADRDTNLKLIFRDASKDENDNPYVCKKFPNTSADRFQTQATLDAEARKEKLERREKQVKAAEATLQKCLRGQGTTEEGRQAIELLQSATKISEELAKNHHKKLEETELRRLVNEIPRASVERLAEIRDQLMEWSDSHTEDKEKNKVAEALVEVTKRYLAHHDYIEAQATVDIAKDLDPSKVLQDRLKDYSKEIKTASIRHKDETLTKKVQESCGATMPNQESMIACNKANAEMIKFRSSRDYLTDYVQQQQQAMLLQQQQTYLRQMGAYNPYSMGMGMNSMMGMGGMGMNSMMMGMGGMGMNSIMMGMGGMGMNPMTMGMGGMGMNPMMGNAPGMFRVQ